jgi:hypothetical protein
VRHLGPRRTAATRRTSTALALLLATGLLSAAATTQAPPPAAAAPSDPAPSAAPSAGQTAVPPDRRAELLGTGWQASSDRAWTSAGDGTGFHLLMADEADGYAWRTLATLAEPGFEADQWIGNVCLTASGRRAVVVYAPRTFANDTDLFDRGGFTALVDLTTGAVTKLAVQTTLAYFNPGCGNGEEAILTRAHEERGGTQLLRIDTATGAIRTKVDVPGQLTSAVPASGGIVAADSGAVVRVDDRGRRRVLAATVDVPFRLASDADGGVVFMERSGATMTRVRRVDARPAAKGGPPGRTTATTVVTGPLTDLDVTSGRGGRVFVTGGAKATERHPTPPSVSILDAPARARISTDGHLAVTSVVRADQPDPRAQVGGAADRRPLRISAQATATGRTVSFTTAPAEPAGGAETGTRSSPALAARSARPGARVAGDPNSPADLGARYCSVPRNDPRNQAMQPKPRQVEWAVDQAVRHSLYVSRPANWKNLGMPAYTPQGLFPPIQLAGGGYVPAQVMLGIAAQESNLWQAARFAVPGVTANPLIGNYYGLDIYNGTEADDWDIDWADADCGYGVTQVTDHMRLAGKEKGPDDTAWPYQTQRAVALDFAANVAAGLQILQTKWNQVTGAGLRVNNGDPARIENWFFAVWAYNSGFYPNKGDGSPWGVGWANNPANPKYPRNRMPFLDWTYEDAAHPQDWPYPEKVMGWAGHPVEVLEAPDTMVSGFRAAWWSDGGGPDGDNSGSTNRWDVKPPVHQFCDASNQCEPYAEHVPNAPDVIGEPAGPCAHKDSAGRYDLRCWYHQSSTWKPDCDITCGHELLRFDPGYAYQDDGVAYPPSCTLAGLPANARIVDDVPDGTPSVRPNCGRPWTNAGTFTFTFKPDGTTDRYPGKIDTHQIGGGFGGHFWFTHTRTAGDTGGRLTVDASWRLSATHNGPMRVFVALPDHGAHTRLARYVVKTANGDRVRLVKQPGTGNRWHSLGAFMFNGTPQVTLSSVTPDGDGTEDIAFDAVAFVPIAGTYKEESIESVALFDEDQNIDIAAPSSWISGELASRQSLHNWAYAAMTSVLGLQDCPAGVEGQGCLKPGVRAYANDFRNIVLAAGTHPVNHPDGTSIPTWIGFANPYLDRPTSDLRPSWFNDDNRFKIRTKATVSFVVGGDGRIVDGSEWAEYEHRTGDTRLPKFLTDLFRLLRDVYGIAPPDLRYRVKDLNAANGAYTSVDPMASNDLPGRAYVQSGKKPVPVDSTGAPSTSNATCVAALTNAGGVDGYRPMLSVAGPANGFEAWVERIADHDGVPHPFEEFARDVQSMFFNDGIIPGVTTSVFDQAPPIWQELNFSACADGTIRKIGGRPVLRASWMPDLYLYRNGKAITVDGAYSGSNQPVIKGDFQKLSAAPDPNHNYPLWPNPFGPCDAATGRSGNPWNISIPSDTGTRPATGHFCIDKTIPPDPSHSS